ncbi:hypothetical protein ACE939_01760 [Aquimarina sp. W85]|uniref:hypothetical protein n=1 Tax=Aquimarina rhodophyticola TaxID=3342246 RepID=UPI00366F0556
MNKIIVFILSREPGLSNIMGDIMIKGSDANASKARRMVAITRKRLDASFFRGICDTTV